MMRFVGGETIEQEHLCVFITGKSQLNFGWNRKESFWLKESVAGRIERGRPKKSFKDLEFDDGICD